MLRVFTNRAAGRLSYAVQLQAIMGSVLCMGGVTLALHAFIDRTFPKNTSDIATKCVNLTAAKGAMSEREDSDGDSAVTASGEFSVRDIETAVSLDLSPYNGIGAASPLPTSASNGVLPAEGRPPPPPPPKPRLTVWEAVQYLAASPQIRCLALMVRVFYFQTAS